MNRRLGVPRTVATSMDTMGKPLGAAGDRNTQRRNLARCLEAGADLAAGQIVEIELEG